ncbi:MAG: chemotaxis-specific protein-glutamate methyltransferase CheB [Ekhidna sp.]|uniref:chemotaxis-specific protein-glutamate methyltransferase CheB n=1 Tax=Ekhidna sp. TaxID=2608089 RepID=UPI0032EE1C1C
MSKKLKILVVDDSAFMRLLISDLVSEDTGVEVVGTANDGLEAVEKVLELHPDVVILDLNMGDYDGLYAVRAIMKDRPTPILILSSVGNTDLQPVFEALKSGAVDYMNKPNRNKSKMREIGAELIQKVKSVARAKPRKIADPISPSKRVVSSRKKSDYSIIAIGASTGGPTAIERVLSVLPADFNIPIIVCQHMPQVFIPPFVQRINTLTELDAFAATKDVEPTPGTIMFCPGHSNLILRDNDGKILVDFTDKKFKEYNNPSINAMMLSVAQVYGKTAVGVLLTGMGKDGVEGMTAIHKAGGRTIAQDKETSIIYGMPKAAVEAGVVDEVLDIKEIGNYLVNEL